MELKLGLSPPCGGDGFHWDPAAKEAQRGALREALREAEEDLEAERFEADWSFGYAVFADSKMTFTKSFLGWCWEQQQRNVYETFLGDIFGLDFGSKASQSLRWQACADKAMEALSMDGAADGSALRLLLHCYRCQAREARGVSKNPRMFFFFHPKKDPY